MGIAATNNQARKYAYCLLGIFIVSMPLLYGEGTRAFGRLQQEVLIISDDQSILAFVRRGLE